MMLITRGSQIFSVSGHKDTKQNIFDPSLDYFNNLLIRCAENGVKC